MSKQDILSIDEELLDINLRKTQKMLMLVKAQNELDNYGVDGTVRVKCICPHCKMVSEQNVSKKLFQIT
jgi:hypothetical protein